MDAETWMRENWTREKRAELIEQIKEFKAEELQTILTLMLSRCDSEAGMAPAITGLIAGITESRAEFAEQIAQWITQATRATEGPWINDYRDILDQNGSVIARIVGDRTTLAEDVANAKLMTAAPELLELLQDAIQGIRWFLDMYPYLQSQVDDEFLVRAEATIAKATE